MLEKTVGLVGHMIYLVKVHYTPVPLNCLLLAQVGTANLIKIGQLMRYLP